jgi:hypothetical protein
MKRRGATSSTLVNVNDHSDDPEYAYKPLSFHGNRIIADQKTEAQLMRAAKRAA